MATRKGHGAYKVKNARQISLAAKRVACDSHKNVLPSLEKLSKRVRKMTMSERHADAHGCESAFLRERKEEQTKKALGVCFLLAQDLLLRINEDVCYLFLDMLSPRTLLKKGRIQPSA